MISFETGGKRLTARLIAGDFIRYQSRFPAEYGCRADLPAAAFIEAVRRAALVAERAGPVRLSFDTGEVTIEAHAEGRARAAEKVVADFAGDQPVISFNPHYLLDGLTAAAVSATAQSPGGQATAGSDAATTTGQPDEPDPAAAAGAAAAGADPDSEPGRIRLEFTSPAKPALITSAGDDGLDTGTDGSASGTPAYRYLLVPLRAPLRP
jgi:hypothetical protein